MARPKAPTIIDPETLRPEWDVAIVLRGEVFALNEPGTFDDGGFGHPPRGLLRWPAVLWRRVRLKLLGTTILEAQRQRLRAVVERGREGVVDRLSAAELADLLHVYMAAQEEYYRRKREMVVAAVRERVERAQPSGGSPAAGRGGSGIGGSGGGSGLRGGRTITTGDELVQAVAPLTGKGKAKGTG